MAGEERRPSPCADWGNYLAAAVSSIGNSTGEIEVTTWGDGSTSPPVMIAMKVGSLSLRRFEMITRAVIRHAGIRK
jgi:hypothetical protein